MRNRQRTRYQAARTLASAKHNVRTDEPTTAIQATVSAFDTDIHKLADMLLVSTDELLADRPQIIVLQALLKQVNIKIGALMDAQHQLTKALRHSVQRQMIERMRVQKR